MKLGQLSKIVRKNTKALKLISTNYYSITIFTIYGQFVAIYKPVFLFPLIKTFYPTKLENRPHTTDLKKSTIFA